MLEPSTALVCNFCSATTSAAGGPLMGCASCRKAAYCSGEHQLLDWPCHKVRCKLYSAYAHSAAGGSSSGCTDQHSTSTTAAAAPAAATATATHQRMESIMRIDSSHQLAESSSSSGAVNDIKMTTSSSGSSHTSGHSSGSSESAADLSALLAAMPADVFLQLMQQQHQQQQQLLLQQQQQQAAAEAAAAAPPPQPPLDASALLADPVLFAQLAQLLSQQQQLQQPAAAVAAPPALPQPQLFPSPFLGSLPQLSQPTFAVPPPPSAFPDVSAFLLAAQQQQQMQPRFDLGAADSTPMMSSSGSGARSAFAPPTTTAAAMAAAAAAAASNASLGRGPPLARQFSSSSSSNGSQHPFVFDCPSSMSKIIDPKPSMTVPPHHAASSRVKAVPRRGGKPVAAAAAAAAAELQRASTSAATDDEAALAGLNGVPPAASRKRGNAPPEKHVTVDNNFLLKIPLDFDASALAMRADARPAGRSAPETRRVAPPPARTAPVPMDDDDDDIQVISQTINRRYKDHSQNVVYNVTVPEHMTQMRNKGFILSRHQAAVIRLRYIAEHVIRSLNEFGWAVVDNFLGEDHVERCNKEMTHLYEKGIFTAGQLMDNSGGGGGRGGGEGEAGQGEAGDEGAPEGSEEGAGGEAKRKTPSPPLSGSPPSPPRVPRNENDIKNVRSDFIYWYDGVDERAQEAVTTRLLISMLDAMILHFEDRIEGKKIGGRSRAMLAIYPGKQSRYVKHVDNPNGDGRMITCIYYCNAKWKLEEHGGALRLYPETSETAMDIDPQADRLVFFWSDRRNPHEVLPVIRHRAAITIWYMDKEERNRELQRKAAARAAARAAAPIAAAAADGVKKEEEDHDHHDDEIDQEALRVCIQQPQLGALLQFGGGLTRAAHFSSPSIGDQAAAAAASAAALGLPRAAAAVGGGASPRSRSDNNMARRFEQARSECTQDEEVESDEEEISDFAPPPAGAQPDYEI